ncbi:hypothetical protein CYY_002088 [Polysphondylium violaceum]|uniref:Protein Asterix n=1 Tax=Polysphondylium violaceum TaxID=133409 RepID=A0A8J4Q1W3_9MYCE|nr:hypothetical protein CYY_002088 [Polysphondylium violaceum]
MSLSKKESAIVHGFEMRPTKSGDGAENPGDIEYWSLLCFAFAFIGIIVKYKICLWISVVCCVAYLANMKAKDAGLRQIVSSVSLSLMGLVMAYFGPNSHMFI